MVTAAARSSAQEGFSPAPGALSPGILSWSGAHIPPSGSPQASPPESSGAVCPPLPQSGSRTTIRCRLPQSLKTALPKRTSRFGKEISARLPQWAKAQSPTSWMVSGRHMPHRLFWLKNAFLSMAVTGYP